MSKNIISGLKRRVAYRGNLLRNGKLELPLEIEATPIKERMWKAMWMAFLNNKGTTSTTYWYDQFDDAKTFNQFIKQLSDLGWVNSVVLPNRHWAEIGLVEKTILELVEPQQLIAIRKEAKFNKYKMQNIEDQQSGSKTRINGTLKNTGITRDGFAKSGTHTFKYDTNMIHKYKESIALNVTKSMRIVMDKHDITIDGADYHSVSKELLDFHMYSPDEEFNLGASYNDSRGRQITSSLKRIFNPVSFKDARSLIVINDVREPMTAVEVRKTTKAIYLFIAELMGIKETESEAKKAQLGRQYFINKQYNEIDLSTEDGRKHLHENIWLERLYNELALFLARDTSKPFTFTVPLELDGQSSMLQVIGSLLNHKPYMFGTNMIGKEIVDSWKVDGMSRSHVKFSATPMLYGSSSSVKDLWTKNKLKFTDKQALSMTYELKRGFYKIANDFKDLIIDNVQPKPDMKVKIWGEEFNIECNRFKVKGEYTKRYPIYDTAKEQVLAIAHTHTKKVPDLKQFRRYFQTLLVHNLDSRLADEVAKAIPWVLAIHDAFIVSPADAYETREVYTSKLKQIHVDRSSILNDYFKSINLAPKAMKQWEQLINNIEPLTEELVVNHMALK